MSAPIAFKAAELPAPPVLHNRNARIATVESGRLRGGSAPGRSRLPLRPSAKW